MVGEDDETVPGEPPIGTFRNQVPTENAKIIDDHRVTRCRTMSPTLCGSQTIRKSKQRWGWNRHESQFLES